MLITQAARGIKGVIQNIDRHLIIPSVQNTYTIIAINPRYMRMIGDVKLVAKGSSALIEKEQRAIRMLEFLNATNNPVDVQLTGLQGRGYLLKEVARTHEIDPDKAVPNAPSTSMMQPMMKPGAPGGMPATSMETSGTPPGPAGTDLAGNAPQGKDQQLMSGRGGYPANPKGGGM